MPVVREGERARRPAPGLELLAGFGGALTLLALPFVRFRVAKPARWELEAYCLSRPAHPLLDPQPGFGYRRDDCCLLVHDRYTLRLGPLVYQVSLFVRTQVREM
jgi:hypothetical protein